MTLPLLLWALTVSRLWRPRKPPQDLLPIEVWDLIFTSLTDHALLQTACVCRIFNELSITMYLRRHNVTAATTSLKIPPYLMRSLDLACVTPQIDSLRCKFWTFDVLRHMRSLREVVGKCQDLTEISLSWSDDLFQVHRYDSRVPYSPNALITILRDILRAFADRTPGPVFVVANGKFYKFQPKDISRWSLRALRGTHSSWDRYGLIPKARSVLKHRTSNVHGSAPPQSHNPKDFYLNRIDSVDLRSIGVESGPVDRFTLIAFPTAYLALEPTQIISTEDLSIILPYIVVPFLLTLDIKTDDMDPTVLGQFLQRHPTIGHIGFSRSGEDTDSFATGRTLCSPPVVLPNLIRLYANDGFALIDLLNAFDCPRVSIIGIRITRPNLRYVTGLKALLHRLSLRTQRTKIELTPSLASPGDRIPLDDDEKAIVRSLHSVHCVCLMTADLAEAQKALPWLMLLPALRRLELSNMIRANLNPLDFDDPDLVAFMEEARAALPGVTEFVVANRLFW